MTPVEHVVASEELMAYLDGELPANRAAIVRDHIEECAACRDLAGHLEQVSRDLAAWQTGPAPALRAPTLAEPNRWSAWGWNFGWRRMAFATSLAGAGLALVIAFQIWDITRPSSMAPSKAITTYARSQPARGAGGVGGGAGGSAVGRGGAAPSRVEPQASATTSQSTPDAASTIVSAQKIIRTVELTVVARAVTKVRPEIDRILQSLGGFVGQIEASDAREGERALTATLRVPGNRLNDAVRSLKGLGRVVHETQSADDVTEQLVDIEARLANSRNTEKRLNDVLKNRTGDVSDVLEVEREIARVREEIERLDAERGNMERRVAYATVTLRVTEERQAALELGPVPLRLQLRNALIDGVREAASGATDLVLWALRTGPMVLLWVALLWWPARKILRAWRHRAAASA